MSKTRIGRVASAVIVAYAVNAILVVATNQLLSPMAVDEKRHHHFLVIDFFSQCLYTVAAGYLGAVIAGPLQSARDGELDQPGPGGGNILIGDLVECRTTVVQHQFASCLCSVRMARMQAKGPISVNCHLR